MTTFKKIIQSLFYLGVLAWMLFPSQAELSYFVTHTLEQLEVVKAKFSEENFKGKISPRPLLTFLPSPPKLYRPKRGMRTDIEWYNQMKNTSAKRDLLQLIVACDFDIPTVRNQAAQIAGQSPGSLNLGQICDIFDWCTDNWKYVNDPIMHGDYVAKASETIANGLNGDCDDFSVLMASLVLAIGGEIRITYSYKEHNAHAYTEVNLGKNLSKKATEYITARYSISSISGLKKDTNGYWWLNLDWSANHPGGNYYNGNRGVVFYILDGNFQKFSSKKSSSTFQSFIKT